MSDTEFAPVPAVVDDLDWYQLFHDQRRGTTWALGSVTRDSFVSVPDGTRPLIERTLELIDGTRTAPDIVRDLPRHVGRVDVDDLSKRLDRANLLAEDAPDKRPRSEYEVLALRLLSVPLSAGNPLLGALARLARPAAAVSVVLVVYAVIAGLPQRALGLRFLQFSAGDWQRWGAILVVSVASVALHEMGHAVVARACGLRPARLTASLYLYITPIVYVTIPGLYSVSRARRLLIWAAGPWTNLVLAATCSLATPYASDLALVALETGITVNLMLVAVNLYPFLPLDGYFIAATLLKVTNLRKRALSLAAMRAADRLPLRSRVVLYVYAAVTWFTMAYLLGREGCEMAVTAYGTYVSTGDLFATADAIKNYLLVIVVIVYGLLARRLQAMRKEQDHGSTER